MSESIFIIDGSKLISSNNATGNVCIPKEITSISNRVFENDSNKINEISFEDESGLLSMEEESFSHLSSLVFLDFRHCLLLENVPSLMCLNCPLLETVYFADDGKIKIFGSAAFSGCFNLSFINFPPSLETLNPYHSIHRGLFRDCFKLKLIHISPSSRLKTLGSHCLYDNHLESFIIPRSVETIGSAPFLFSYKLKHFEFEAGNPHFIVENDIVYSLNKISVILAYPTIQGNVTLPSTVQQILNQGFRDCKYLTGITIPNSVTSINSNAFSTCTSLRYVFIPSNVTYLDRYSFRGCPMLYEFIIAGEPDIDTLCFSGSNISCGFQISDILNGHLISKGITVGRSPCPYSPFPITPHHTFYTNICECRIEYLNISFIYQLIIIIFSTLFSNDQ